MRACEQRRKPLVQTNLQVMSKLKLKRPLTDQYVSGCERAGNEVSKRSRLREVCAW
jgi:hypothetical protein